jgi:hypothetical protein
LFTKKVIAMLSYLLPVIASSALFAATVVASEPNGEPSLNTPIGGANIGTTSVAPDVSAEREQGLQEARLSAFRERLALEMEPCINSSVSASGSHVSQSLEDAARYFATGVVYSDDPNYVFMVEGQIIAPAHLVQR